VATGIISEGEIAPPTRVVLRDQHNVQVLLGNVTHIDLANQRVVSELLGHSYETPYDTLIVAAGAGQSYFGNDQLRRIRAWHEIDRRRARVAGPNFERLRAGRTIKRPRAPQEAC